MFVIKSLLDHYAGEGFLADLDIQFCAQFGVGCVDEGHADALSGGDGVVAGGHLTHFFTVFHYGIAMAWDGLVFQFDADDSLLDTFRLLLDEGLASDEFWFVEFAEHAQTGHHW